MNATWLTVDFDDERHVPSFSGHPTRSKYTFEEINDMRLKENLSDRFQHGLKSFEQWMSTHDHPVTLFIIADLFESEDFNLWLRGIIENYNNRITVGCHGLSHKSWSAWPEDKIAFSHALITATALLEEHAGDNFRRWFRAPGGYIAPWMVETLSKNSYVLDSSINPSWVVQRKAGKGNTWKDIEGELERFNIISRPWKTYLTLPINGPALTLFPLSLIAHRGWRKTPPPLLTADFESTLLSKSAEITTVYWHILDHARKNGAWKPPLAI